MELKYRSVQYVHCKHRNIDLGLVQEELNLTDRVTEVVKKLVELEQTVVAGSNKSTGRRIDVTVSQIQAKLQQLVVGLEQEYSAPTNQIVDTLEEVKKDYELSIQGSNPKSRAFEELKQQFVEREKVSRQFESRQVPNPKEANIEIPGTQLIQPETLQRVRGVRNLNPKEGQYVEIGSSGATDAQIPLGKHGLRPVPNDPVRPSFWTRVVVNHKRKWLCGLGVTLSAVFIGFCCL